MESKPTLLKAHGPIVVMPSGTIVFLQPIISAFEAVFIKALQLPRLSYTGLASSTMMDSMVELLFQNAVQELIDVTDDGIWTEVNGHP